MRRDLGRIFGMALALPFLAWAGLALAQESKEKGAKGPDKSGEATAQQPAREGERALGTISSVGIDRLELKRADGSSLIVLVGELTRYRQGQQEIQLEDLKPGDRVFIRGEMKDNQFVAMAVRRVTDKEMERFRQMGGRTSGEIVSIENNQLKIRNPRQGEIVVTVNDQTVFMKEGRPITLKDLKAGDRIFAVGKEENGQFTAVRIMTGAFRGRRGGRPREEPNHSP